MANFRKALALGLLNAADKGLGQYGKKYEDESDIQKQIRIRQATAKNSLAGFEEYEGLDPNRKDDYLRYRHGGQVGLDQATGKAKRLYKPTSGGGVSANLKKLSEQARVKKAQGKTLSPIEQNYINEYERSKMSAKDMMWNKALEDRNKNK